MFNSSLRKNNGNLVLTTILVILLTVKTPATTHTIPFPSCVVQHSVCHFLLQQQFTYRYSPDSFFYDVLAAMCYLSVCLHFSFISLLICPIDFATQMLNASCANSPLISLAHLLALILPVCYSVSVFGVTVEFRTGYLSNISADQ